MINIKRLTILVLFAVPSWAGAIEWYPPVLYDRDGCCQFMSGCDPYCNDHLGIDWMVDLVGTEVNAIATGYDVAFYDSASGFGGCGVPGGALWIKHRKANGDYFWALYGHVKNPTYTTIPEGQVIPRGAKVAEISNFDPCCPSGSDCPHLHFGIWDGASYPAGNWGYGTQRSFVDPNTFMASTTPYGFSFISSADYYTGDEPHSVYAEDVDGDGDYDLAVANRASDNISILINFGNGLFAYPAVYSVGDAPRSVILADFDNDNDFDLASANRISNDVSVLLNDGSGFFSAATDYYAGNDPWSVFAADLDDDGDIDIAVANPYVDYISVLLNNGDATFAAGITYGTDTRPYCVFGTDLDGDDDIDLVTANHVASNISYLEGNGDGTFIAKIDYGAGPGPHAVISADFDGDNDEDLSTANYHGDNISILENNSDGSFVLPVHYSADEGPYSIHSADYDNDNDDDLAVTNIHSNNISVFTNDGSGIFALHSHYATGASPFSVFSADLDGDSDVDLVVANRDSDNISILINTLYSSLTGAEKQEKPYIGNMLQQNRPNPFNPTTTISFNLSARFHANLSIFDVEGKLVITLVDETVGEGFKEVTWDGRDSHANPVSSGVYFYRLKAGNKVLTRKMVLLK